MVGVTGSVPALVVVLMRENPVRGYEIGAEKNRRRPVASQDRFEAIRVKTDEHIMEIRWDGKRKTRRSYIRELLDIVNGTGRRISAVCKVRYEDPRFSDGTPHGSIRWPAQTTSEVAKRRCRSDPVSGRRSTAYFGIVQESEPDTLFPSLGNPAKPITRHLADKWLREAKLRPVSSRRRARSGMPTSGNGQRSGNISRTPTWQPPVAGPTRRRSSDRINRPTLTRCSRWSSKAESCATRSSRTFTATCTPRSASKLLEILQPPI
jgi:hypothetical protein